MSDLIQSMRDYWQRQESEAMESAETPKPVKCPKCHHANLDLTHDDRGMYYACPHCKWDSLGLYKTRNKYGAAS